MAALGQTSAIDRDQQAYSARKARERAARISELWRWLLTQPMGREFLWEVLLADVGYDRPLALHDPQATVLVEQAALRNLALHWMNQHVRRHPDKYREVLADADKRERAERADWETQRAGWARDEETE